MEIKKTYYERVADTIIKNLNKRNMEGHYFPDSASAKEFILKSFAPKSTITWGGSMTIKEMGLLDEIRCSDYNVIEHKHYTDDNERRESFGKIVCADYFLMSTNAITLDGELINIDGFGNRVACLIAGPENVYVITGMNKVVDNVDEGISRTKNVATSQNCIRLKINNPCAATGKCHDCKGDQTICNQIVITKGSRIKNRIKVILVGEPLGY